MRGLCGAAASLWLAAPAIAAPVSRAGLGQGRYARLHTLLEKTFLNVDILSLELQFDQATADKVEQIVRDKKYSKAIEEQIVRTVIGASDAYAGLQFMMDFDAVDFIAGIRDSMRRAYKADMISRDDYLRGSRGLTQWFAFLGKRGIRDGDWLYHRGGPERLRSVYVDRDGRKRMDVVLEGSGRTRTLIASYLPPGTDLREPLVRSLFA